MPDLPSSERRAQQARGGPDHSVIVRAASSALSVRGLSVSLDELSAAVGVHSDALLEQFGTRDALVAAALDSLLDMFERELREAVDHSDAPLEEWLAQLTTRLCLVQLSGGAAIWQLAAADDTALPEELAAVNRRRRELRKTLTEHLARSAWKRIGGRGACPTVIVDAVALTYSLFTTRSLLTDGDIGIDRIIDVTVATLGSLLRSQLTGSGT